MTALNLAEIEQTKLLANALDRASTACFTVGIATPVAAMIYGVGNIGIRFGIAVLFYLTGWLLISAFLHYMARRVLRKLA